MLKLLWLKSENDMCGENSTTYYKHFVLILASLLQVVTAC
jgi:hypothetical protein